MSTERADESTVLLDSAIRRTEEFMASMPKATRKKYGQFFTSGETAVFMASMFDEPKGKDDNYIVSQREEYNETLLSDKVACRYDWVIGNPPYLKVGKNAPEALAMPDVCHGAPNLYFLFAAMGMFNLRDGGELVYIMPRSWTSGAYFRRFRKKMLHDFAARFAPAAACLYVGDTTDKALVRDETGLSALGEVWIAEAPDHMIHLNGDRFMGPRSANG